MTNKDKDKCKEYMRQWYQDNEEHKKQYNKQWYQDNKEHKKQYEKQWYQDNKEHKKQYSKQWHKDNPEYSKQYSKQWHKDNPEYNKQWHKDNPEDSKQQKKQWYQDNKEYKNQYNKQWHKNNPEYDKQWSKNRYWIDFRFKLNSIMRSTIRSSLHTKKISKNRRRWEDLVGYTLEDLKTHLERQFEPWMNWENFGRSYKLYTKWSLDHIVPLSAFNFTSTDDEEFKLAWGLDNLQPLDTYINLFVKNDRLDYYIEFPIQK